MVKESLPWYVVNAYRATFRGQELPGTGFQALRMREHGSYWRACQVAASAKYIVVPKPSADACLIAAYAMLKCEEVYAQVRWEGSRLTPLQRERSEKYLVLDFEFWSCTAVGRIVLTVGV